MEELPVTVRLAVLFFLLAVNSFFAAAEVALVSVRRTRMRQLADAGNAKALLVLHLLEAPDRMLSATQLGVTLASLGLGWAGEGTVYRLTQPLLERVLSPGMEQVGHAISFVFSFTVITFLHMVLGEVVPKNLAMERSERLALAVATPLDYFARVTGLFVSAVRGTAEKLSRLIGLKLATGEEGFTAEELKLIVSVSKKQGEQAERQEEMIHRVIDFYDLTAREVMVPRQEMVALPSDAGPDQVIDTIVRTRHSRIPIYEESVDNVIGVIYAKAVWTFVQKIRRWQALTRPAPTFNLRSFLQPVEFVPETKLLHELLNEFQEKRFQMAMIVDEFGTVVGLATIEDALEQIVGEIREEHEPAVALQALDGPLEFDGITNIRDLETQYKIELPYDAGFETLAGFLLSRLGHIPTAGESVEFEGRKFTVLQMERNRIFRVRIDLPQAPETQEPEKGAEDA
ncbi:MAG: hemolysin family protein [Acidobacteria bacterium]|nr:hemolysin family protein [Acidobacteriota bacterium]MDA1233728.1 hemolysin family protein [Acidobacteriota bacterium]